MNRSVPERDPATGEIATAARFFGVVAPCIHALVNPMLPFAAVTRFDGADIPGTFDRTAIEPGEA